MSSSRVHSTLTGALPPMAFTMLTTSTMTSASGTARRPKKPPGVIGVQPHLRRLDAHDLGSHRLVEIRHLVPGPDLQPAIVEAGDGVERLHRRMRQIGELVSGLDDPGRTGHGRRGIAFLPGHRQPCRTWPSWRYSAISSSLPRFSASLSSHSTTSASRPCSAAQVCSATTAMPRGVSTTSTTPLTGAGRLVVEAARLAAEARRPGQHRRQHARQADVDRERVLSRRSWRRYRAAAACRCR